MSDVTAKYFRVFYSKDVNKKKRTFSQGILSWQNKKTKLFNSDGQLLVQVNEKTQPEINQQYVIGYKFAVLIDSEVSKQDFSSGRIFISIVDGSNSSNLVGSVSSNKPEPKPALKKKPKQNKEKEKNQQQNSLSLQKNSVKQTTQLKNGLVIENIIFTKLRQHQIEGVQFMYDCLLGFKSQSISGCILADFMGLGKTLQTITLIYSLLKMKKISKCIVISPLTLVYVWQKQCKKWLDNKLSPLIALGDGEQVRNVCKQFANNQYRMLVLSYEGFYRFIDILDRKCDLIVFDEGHRLKNKNSKVYKKILNFSCRKRVLLTGTPLQNNLQELYTCISVVNPSLFSSQQLFNNVFQKPILNGMAKKASQLQRKIAVQRTLELANKIKEFSLRRKADTLQKYLPKKRQFFVLFKLTNLQKLWYERLLKIKETVSDVLGFLNLFRKLFTHPQILKNDRLQKSQSSEFLQDSIEQVSYKMNFVLDVCKKASEKDQKVIVVSYFTSTLDFVGKMLRNNEISCIKLDGKVDGKQRETVVNSFERQKTVLLLSGKAGGTGLTLVTARTMIMLQPDWNPSNDSQVIGRIWRQGQTQQVNIYRLLIISSFEQRIIQRQQLKNTLSEKLIDQSKSVNSGYDFMDMRKLFVQHSDRSLIFNESENILDKFYSQSGLQWQGVVMAVCRQSHAETVINDKNVLQDKIVSKVENEFADGLIFMDGIMQENQDQTVLEQQQHQEQKLNQDSLQKETKIWQEIKQQTVSQQKKEIKVAKLKRLNNKLQTKNDVIVETEIQSNHNEINIQGKQINKKKKMKKYEIIELQQYRKMSPKCKQLQGQQQQKQRTKDESHLSEAQNINDDKNQQRRETQSDVSKGEQTGNLQRQQIAVNDVYEQQNDSKKQKNNLVLNKIKLKKKHNQQG